MRIKSVSAEKKYWSSVCIACSQVTFGVLWATLLVLPLDLNKVILIVWHLIVSLFFWSAGILIIKK